MRRLSGRMILIAVATALTLAIGGTAAAASLGRAAGNGRPGAGPKSGLGCSIVDDSGATVTVVNIDNQMGSDAVYWISSPGRASATSETIAVVGPAGDPWSMKLKLNDGGDTNVPFGVPYWGDDETSGSYTVTVTFDHGGPRTCTFTTNP